MAVRLSITQVFQQSIDPLNTFVLCIYSSSNDSSHTKHTQSSKRLLEKMELHSYCCNFALLAFFPFFGACFLQTTLVWETNENGCLKCFPPHWLCNLIALSRKTDVFLEEISLLLTTVAFCCMA